LVVTAIFGLLPARVKTTKKDTTRAAGINPAAFEQAFTALRAAKISAPDLAQLTRDYANIVNKRLTKTASYYEIRTAFVQRARFENKLK
jgi:hypothetical protein